MTVPYVRASTRPFTAITLYLSKRKEFDVGLYNVSALSLRFAYVEYVEIMAVYYLAKYRYFLMRLGLVWLRVDRQVPAIRRWAL